MIRAFLAGLRDGLAETRVRGARRSGPIRYGAVGSQGGLIPSLFGLDQTGFPSEAILNYGGAQLTTMTGAAVQVTLGAVGHVCVENRAGNDRVLLRADGVAVASSAGAFARELQGGQSWFFALPPNVTSISLWGTAGNLIQVIPAIPR